MVNNHIYLRKICFVIVNYLRIVGSILLKRKFEDITIALDVAIRSNIIWKTRCLVQGKNFRRKWDAH